MGAIICFVALIIVLLAMNSQIKDKHPLDKISTLVFNLIVIIILFALTRVLFLL
jgi:hypothetical protein